MRETAEYYDAIARGYHELYGEEQLEKLSALRIAVGGRVLDLGCGTSLAAGKVSAGVVIGLDSSKQMILSGRSESYVYAVGSAEMMPFRDNSFEVVIAVTVLQDAVDPARALSEMLRVGGKVVVSVPCKSSLDLAAAASAAGSAIKGVFRSGKDIFYVI